MKRSLSLLLAVLLVAALFAGCGKSGNKAVLGKWVWEYEGLGEMMSFTFNADGTGALESFGESEAFTYKVSGSKLLMTKDGETDSVDFRIDGNTLILDLDGEELELVKK